MPLEATVILTKRTSCSGEADTVFWRPWTWETREYKSRAEYRAAHERRVARLGDILRSALDDALRLADFLGRWKAPVGDGNISAVCMADVVDACDRGYASVSEALTPRSTCSGCEHPILCCDPRIHYWIDTEFLPHWMLQFIAEPSVCFLPNGSLSHCKYTLASAPSFSLCISCARDLRSISATLRLEHTALFQALSLCLRAPRPLFLRWPLPVGPDSDSVDPFYADFERQAQSEHHLLSDVPLAVYVRPVVADWADPRAILAGIFPSDDGSRSGADTYLFSIRIDLKCDAALARMCRPGEPRALAPIPISEPAGHPVLGPAPSIASLIIQYCALVPPRR